MTNSLYERKVNFDSDIMVSGTAYCYIMRQQYKNIGDCLCHLDNVPLCLHVQVIVCYGILEFVPQISFQC